MTYYECNYKQYVENVKYKIDNIYYKMNILKEFFGF
jgi:hypothetical protein